jgi:hypothetical protein
MDNYTEYWINMQGFSSIGVIRVGEMKCYEIPIGSRNKYDGSLTRGCEKWDIPAE